MAFKTFVDGAVLTAADVNTYLMKQAVIVCTSGTRPASPVDGMVIYETDTDQMLVYQASKYVPAGPQLADALNISAASPFLTGLGAGSITTELSTKMRLTAANVYSGHAYRIYGMFLVAQSGGTGSDWTINIREDNTSGTQVGAFYVPNIGANATTVNFSVPWPCAANATNKTFVFTYTRNVGTQTFSIYNTFNSAQTLWIGIERVGDSALIRTVP